MRSKNPDNFLSAEEKKLVEDTIKETERKTSAEIKLVIVRHCWVNIVDKAASIFQKYELHKTKLRNCVLIMLVTANRRFIVFGDEGIDAKVGINFWEDVRDIMECKFREDKFGDGIAEGIRRIGEKLVQFFPGEKGDVNEVSNEVACDE